MGSHSSEEDEALATNLTDAACKSKKQSNIAVESDCFYLINLKHLMLPDIFWFAGTILDDINSWNRIKQRCFFKGPLHIVLGYPLYCIINFYLININNLTFPDVFWFAAVPGVGYQICRLIRRFATGGHQLYPFIERIIKIFRP